MKSVQARLFEHEDLPLFSGAAPVAAANAPRPQQAQGVGLPIFTTTRPIWFFSRSNGDNTLSGEERKMPAGTPVGVIHSGDRSLVATTDGWLAWVHAENIE